MLVALGKNWRAYPPRRPPDGWRLRLSLESKITALAAGHLFRSGQTDAILISAGQTAGPAWPSEAEAMRRYLTARYPEIPDDAVLLEDISIDTAHNAELVAALLPDPKPPRIILLTVGVHLARSLRLFSAFGVPVERGIAAEDILAERSRRHRTLVARYRRSPRATIERLKELLLRVLLALDSKGTLLRRLTSRIRGG